MDADAERFAGKPSAMRFIGNLSETSFVVLDPVGNKFSVWSSTENEPETFLFNRRATDDDVHKAMANYEYTRRIVSETLQKIIDGIGKEKEKV